MSGVRDTTASKQRPTLKKRVSCEDNTVNIDFWSAKWANRLDAWQEEDGNKLIWEYMNGTYMRELKKDPSQIKVFVPLCGKAKDMKMLYDLGFTVVGIEYVRQGIDEFFSENQIPYREHSPQIDSRKFPYVTSEDERVMLIEADIFECAAGDLPYTQYDIIWDRAAFNNLNFCDRARYAKFEASLLADDGVILMIGYEYDRSVFGGPPTHVSRECLLESYGEYCSAKEVSRTDVMGPDHPKREHMLERGLPPHMFEVLHVMKQLLED